MKQIFQNLSNGSTYLEDVPCPDAIKNNILIQTAKSLISVTTELKIMGIDKVFLHLNSKYNAQCE